jgi:hypothetical protein
MFKTQVSTREDVIRDGRGLDFAEIPIRIYHCVYAHFHRTMSTPFEVLDFNQTELDRASVLLDLFSARYLHQKARIAAIRSTFHAAVHPGLLVEQSLHLGERTQLPSESTSKEIQIKPDGALFQGRPDGTEGLSALAEVKNEAGEGGCDPAAQAAYDYTALAVSDKASCARFFHGFNSCSSCVAFWGQIHLIPTLLARRHCWPPSRRPWSHFHPPTSCAHVSGVYLPGNREHSRATGSSRRRRRGRMWSLKHR